MKNKLTDEKKYPKCCKNCFYGRLTKDTESVLCEKNGVMELNDSCKKYKYDPLKRIPGKVVIDTGYTEDDFKL